MARGHLGQRQRVVYGTANDGEVGSAQAGFVSGGGVKNRVITVTRTP